MQVPLWGLIFSFPVRLIQTLKRKLKWDLSCISFYVAFNTSTLKTFKWKILPLDSAQRTDWAQKLSNKKTDSGRNGNMPLREKYMHMPPCDDEMPCRDTWAGLEVPEKQGVLTHVEYHTNTTISCAPTSLGLVYSSLSGWLGWRSYCLQLLSSPFQSPSWPLCVHASSGTSVKASWVSLNI